jgi:phosphoglycolate phosphatase
MVGDSETDVKAARAAGLPVIGVTFGYTDRHISEFAPDSVISHFDALIPEIERYLGPING